MSNRHRWNWQAHLTDEEAAKLAILWREWDEAQKRLDAIKLAESEIRRLATARAKAAGDVLEPLIQ